MSGPLTCGSPFMNSTTPSLLMMAAIRSFSALVSEVVVIVMVMVMVIVIVVARVKADVF